MRYNVPVAATSLAGSEGANRLIAAGGRRSNMEEIRTPSPPTEPKSPSRRRARADGDIDGLEPALSDVLTPSKQDGTPPGTLRKPIKFTYGSSNSLSSLPLPQAAPIDFRASGSSRAVASPPASPAALREQTSNASEKFDGVSFEEDPFRLSARDLDLREVIGTGAFGRVHTAKWRNTPVAVKVLFHDCSRDDVNMFHKEIQLMARLHHPNIAQFLGYAKLGPDELVLVLELFENGSLEQYVPKERPGVRTTLEFCRDMARAVEYLHGREPHITVHRDLKPPNFLVCKCLRIKLGDFGIARNLNSPRARLDASGGGIPRVSSSSKLSSRAGDLDSSRGPFPLIGEGGARRRGRPRLVARAPRHYGKRVRAHDRVRHGALHGAGSRFPGAGRGQKALQPLRRRLQQCINQMSRRILPMARQL